MNDNRMPDGWHLIKSILLKEISMSANFQHCYDAADALFHSRLVAERVAKANKIFKEENIEHEPQEIDN